MGNVSQVVPTIHPCVAICDAGVAGHSIEFRDAAATDYADEVTLLVATVVAQTAYELFADPALVEAAWDEFRAARLTHGRAAAGRWAGARMAAAPRWTVDPNRRRPQKTPRLTSGPALRAPRLGASPGGSMAERQDPGRDGGFAAANGWNRDYETYSDFDLPTYVGPTHVHEPALDHRPGRSCAPAKADVAIVGAPFDDASAIARVPASARARSARRSTPPARSTRSSSASSRSRSSTWSTPATRTSCRPGPSGPTR